MTVRAPHFLLFSESRDVIAHEARPGKWRFILESVDGESKLEASDDEPNTSRERLELLAVVRGLEALDQPSRVTLVTSSRYVSRGLRHGIDHWRETGWHWERFGEMAPIKNRDLWKRVDRALKYHTIECRSWRFDSPHDVTPPAGHVRPEQDQSGESAPVLPAVQGQEDRPAAFGSHVETAGLVRKAARCAAKIARLIQPVKAALSDSASRQSHRVTRPPKSESPTRQHASVTQRLEPPISKHVGRSCTPSIHVASSPDSVQLQPAEVDDSPIGQTSAEDNYYTEENC